MDQTTSKIKYLKDYTESDFLIEKVNLEIELTKDNALVINTMQIERSNKSNRPTKLILNGNNQEILYIKINGNFLNILEYEKKSYELIINIPDYDRFEVTIANLIFPDQNDSLEGLYKAENIYLTQCEPHGFRNITYFLDRPDIMAVYTTKLIASKNFPVLLSNGDKIDQGELSNNRHFALWHDSSKKPSYLFAMVIGDLSVKKDQFITKSGKKVSLEFYSLAKDLDKIDYAIESLKSAMKWDERVFNLEYDLSTYMIVATSRFNSGAMENKGLNIFNSQYVLATKDSTTDLGFMEVHDVIAHEYFHNWTGNRITLRDWFELSLKEGLTVFREHEFSSDIFSRSIKRIDDTNFIRSRQFQEDSGPLSHAVRPESYIKMDNFYTATVYEKGAELIKMLKIIIGSDNFAAAMQLYFNRHDGQAVTTDDFIKVMEDISKKDLSQFKLWYSQKGTPEIKISDDYDKSTKVYILTIEQFSKNLANKPFIIPIKIGLIGSETGMALDYSYNNIIENESVLELSQKQQTFTFFNVVEKPVPSLLRDFSAPVKINYPYSCEQLLFLMTNDNNEFNRWDASHKYFIKFLLQYSDKIDNFEIPTILINTIKKILANNELDKAFVARLLTLPTPRELYEEIEIIHPDIIYKAIKNCKRNIGIAIQKELIAIYHQLNEEIPYNLSKECIARRSLKNTALAYIFESDEIMGTKFAIDQLKRSDNLTDRLASLRILANSKNEKLHGNYINQFYETWKGEDLVVDAWFSIQSLSELSDTTPKVMTLLEHQAFDIKIPNKVYALLGSFAQNIVNFHAADGSGYNLYVDAIIKIDQINPNVASRLSKEFNNWRKLEPNRQKLIKDALNYILNQRVLSENLREILEKLCYN